MNYVRHLNAFFTRIRNDNRLTSAHVSLYLAVFHYWNLNRFQNPFPVRREEIMQLAKIGSKNTYHKCLKDLHQANYLHYFPSASRYYPVKIFMIGMDKIKPDPLSNQPDLFSAQNEEKIIPETEVLQSQIWDANHPQNETFTVSNMGHIQSQKWDTYCPKNGTCTVPNMGHYIKHININHKCVCKTPTEIFNKNEINEKINLLRTVPNMGQLEQEEKEENNPPKPDIPSLPQVESFFQSQNFPKEEAKKFYLYNQAKGWMLTATIPVADWRAMARKWMLNKPAGKTKEPSQQNSTHHLKTDKNYGEPL